MSSELRQTSNMSRPAWKRTFEVILLLVQRDFRGRYKHTHVGMLWAVLNPLMYLLIFYFVFQIVLKVQVPHYASFVFTGILSWNWFQSALVQSTGSISFNPGLVTQPGFPVAALPVSATGTQFLNLLLSVPILAVLLALEGAPFTLSYVFLPIIVAVQFALTLAIAYLLAALNVRYRDVEHILPILLQLGYFITPIFYTVDRVDPAYRWAFTINPMFHVVHAYRTVILEGRNPEMVPLFALALFSLLLLAFAFSHFEKAKFQFLENI